jgi:hypothetical protein
MADKIEEIEQCYLSTISSSDSTISDSDSEDENSRKKKKRINKKVKIEDAIITVDERSLFTEVDRYFKNKCTLEQIIKMINIIRKKDYVSLRLLNWFSMKHSSSMQGMEVLSDDGRKEVFYIRISYKARLKAHSKKYFDPFRRGKRFDYYYDKNDPTKCIETTLCQLNYFKWLFCNNLIEYVDNNYDALAKKMAIYVKKKREEKQKKKDKNEKTKYKKDIKVQRYREDDNIKLEFTF